MIWGALLVFFKKMYVIIIIMKRILCFLSAVLMAAGVINLGGFISEYVFADACTDNRNFLMLKPWDSGLSHDGTGCSVVMGSMDETTFVWTIILNIVYDLFAVVGVIALGFVIYAGYAFLTSGGDPGKAAKAKKSLVSSIAGIILSLSSTVLVNTISNFIKPSESADDVLAGGLNLAYAVGGVIATVFIIYGGYHYLTSSGDPSKARKGRQVLIYAIIGLVVVLAAAGITNFVVGAL